MLICLQSFMISKIHLFRVVEKKDTSEENDFPPKACGGIKSVNISSPCIFLYSLPNFVQGWSHCGHYGRKGDRGPKRIRARLVCN